MTNTGSASGGNSSYSYQWQISSNGTSGWSNLSGATGATYNPPALTSSRWYRRRVISCSQTMYTNTVKVTIHPNLSAGSIGNAQTLCYNGNASTLTNTGSASGGDGSITYQWQYSTNGSSGWTNLSGQTGTTYNPPALTSSRWYRRRAISCGQTKYTNSVKITIHPNLSAGSIGNAQTLCYNGNASTLTNTGSASGGDGSITYQWQYSTNGSSGWTNLSGQTSTTYNPPALTSSRWYRRRAISCGQTKYTNSIKITIHPNLTAGSIGNAQTLCYNGNASTLTNTGSAGGGDGSLTYQWQYSTNGSSGWTNLSGQTGTTYNPPALTSSRWYRRRVISCGQTKYTNNVKITIHPTLNAGSIGNAQTLCYNGNASALTNTSTASGGDGSISYQWQYSTNGISGWTNLSGQTSTTYDPPALTSSRWYRRRAVSCGETKYSNSVKITIHPTLSAGSIGNAQTVCYNGNPSALTNSASASGGDGSISYQWQYSTNGSSGWTNLSSETGSTYNPPPLTSSRWYRRQAVSCGETKYTSTVKITIHPQLIAGSIGNGQTLCYNGNAAPLSNNSSASGGNGSINYQWQYSSNGTSGWTDLTGETGSTYDPPALTSSRWYRRVATSCLDTKYSNSVSVTIHTDLLAGQIGGTQTICANTSPSVITNTTSASGGGSGLTYQWQESTNGTSWNNISGAINITYQPGTLTSDRWYRRGALTNDCTTEFTSSVKVTVDASSVGGSVAGSIESFGIASGNLTLSGQNGNIIKWQYKTSGSWVDISNTSTTQSYTNIQETTEYRAIVKNGTCNEVGSSIATVTILNIPSVDLGITQNVRPGYGTTLEASTGHANYQWFRNNTEIQNGANNQLIVSKPGTYKVTVSSSGGATYTTGDAIISNQLEMDENAVITYSYRIPVSDTSDPFLYDVDEQSISAAVYDGLGRPTQNVMLQASPQLKDIVTPVAYDDFGRQTKKYLPYVANDLSILNKPNALNSTYTQSDHYNYYSNESVYASQEAFSEAVLEPSPLNRPQEQGSPGSAWQPGLNTIKFNYEIADSAEVLDWDYSSMLSDAKSFFDAGELFKNRVTDEDGNQTVEYTNKQGQTILKKSQVNGATWAETYYIYDDFGQLAIVLPPEAVSLLDTDFFVQAPPARKNFLNTWAFLYDYDGRNRMIMKKVPAADSVFMIYDRWDRLVLTQDGVQRVADAWLFTKYDVLNRPIITGKAIINGSTQQVRDLVAASVNRYDSLDANGVNQYTDMTYPTQGLVNEYLTVSYYDDYAFLSHADWTSEGLEFTNPTGMTQNTSVRGQVTGTMTKTGDGLWIKSVSYYDDKYRPIQSQSTNHLGGKDVVTNYYDFIGQVEKTISAHSNATETTTIARQFEYDHVGRLINTFHELAEDVDWTDLEGVVSSGDDLTKTGTNGYGNGGAASAQKLAPGQDGYIEFSVESNYRVLVGFSEENTDAHYNTIDYCVYLSPSWSLTAYENGSNRGGLGNYEVGDLIRVERKNGYVLIKKNGIPLYTSSVISSSRLIVDVALYNTGDKVTNAKFSKGSVLLSQNQYNELGELIRKDLHKEVSAYLQFNASEISGFGGSGQDIDSDAWSIVNEKTLKLGEGNTWKKHNFSYEVTPTTMIEFEFKSTTQGEIQGLAFENDNNLSSSWLFQLYGTQAWGNQDFSYTGGGNWQKIIIPVGEYYSGSMSYLAFANDHDGGGQDANSYFRNIKVYENDDSAIDSAVPFQSLDYTYNIRGWLTSINDAALSDPSDLFGMELLYNAQDASLGNTQLHNGNISAMKWSNYDGGIDERAYTFGYDKLNRLTAANHYVDNGSTNKFRVQGLNYDLNGNIQSLQRNAQSTTNYMDDLSYTYTGNQLMRVSDAATDTTGFYDGNTTGDDYFYDANGNMTKDRNKDIDSIYYNHLNLPVKVEFATVGDSITYLYDAAGIKLNQVVYKAGDTLKVTDYVGEFIYENDSLEIIQHEEGRIVPKYSVDGSSIEFYDYQYHLKDHLGNVRVTFSTTPESYTIVETFETGEENGWQDLHRHVLDTANTTIGGDEVELLQSGQTGAMVFLSVNKRDTLNLSVNANYEIAPSNNNFLSTAYNALFTSFDNIYGSGAEAGVSSSSTTFNDALSGTDMGGKNDASTAPRAFINYIFFDKEMGYVSAGFTQITTAAQGIGVHENVVMPEFVADREGYVLAYLSNENQEAVNVHFDDFTVYHGKTNVVSTQDYYPFGLTFNESVRVASVGQNFLYNQGTGDKQFRTERVKELDLNVDMTKYRVYDYAIGRFWQVDPLSDVAGQEVQSTYQYSFNNPMLYNDPLGDCVPCLKALAKQGIKWAARTSKGGFKPVSQKSAQKMLKNKQTVYQTSNNTSNKQAKRLMESATDKKVVKHEGHQLKNGKTGMDHYQPKDGGGAHVNVPKVVAGATAAGGVTAANASSGGSENNSGSGDDSSSSMDVNSIATKAMLMSSPDPMTSGTVTAGNAGKLIFGDNNVGNFIDDWINPFSLASDVLEAANSNSGATGGQQSSSNTEKEDEQRE